MTDKCMTCGKALKDWRICDPNDPAMDCGGDCLECQKEYEHA